MPCCSSTMGACCSSTTQNCCFSTILLGYACSNGGIQKLQNKFAFFPPSPPSYQLSQGQVQWLDPRCEAEAQSVAQLPVANTVCMLRTRSGHEIAFFHFEPRTPLKSGARRRTLLWSHGNALDCGELYGFLTQLALDLDVNVCAYDYSGYGASNGKPSERHLNESAEAAYEHLVSALNVDAGKELIVYGQSVGSGPSMRLAHRHPVCALVLHSPIASGLRVLAPSWSNVCSPVRTFYCCDIFPNVRPPVECHLAVCRKLRALPRPPSPNFRPLALLSTPSPRLSTPLHPLPVSPPCRYGSPARSAAPSY